MEMGDAKKNVPLAIVAVLAIGFAVTRVIPSKPAQAKAGNDRVAPKPVEAGDASFLKLERDPFSSAKLVRPTEKPVSTESLKTQAGTNIGNTPFRIPMLPEGGIGPDGMTLTSTSGGTGKNTVEGADPNRQEGKEELKVLLMGIVGAGQAQAYISINGAEEKQFKESEKLGQGWKVLKIADGVVTLMKDKKKVTLTVGKELSL